jgi:hypothetical protein
MLRSFKNEIFIMSALSSCFQRFENELMGYYLSQCYPFQASMWIGRAALCSRRVTSKRVCDTGFFIVPRNFLHEVMKPRWETLAKNGSYLDLILHVQILKFVRYSDINTLDPNLSPPCKLVEFHNIDFDNSIIQVCLKLLNDPRFVERAKLRDSSIQK